MATPIEKASFDWYLEVASDKIGVLLVCAHYCSFSKLRESLGNCKVYEVDPW